MSEKKMSLKEVLREYESWKATYLEEKYDQLYAEDLINKFLEAMSEKHVVVNDKIDDLINNPFDDEEDLLSDRFMF